MPAAASIETRHIFCRICEALCGGPDAIERISGMARLTGIPGYVHPAAGPQTTQCWSGLPEA